MNIRLNDIYDEVSTDVAIATVSSISRSIVGFPFPHVIKNDEEAMKVLEIVFSSFEKFKDKNEYRKIDIETFDILTKKILEEASVIPSLFNEKVKKALIVSDSNAIAVLVNFNNHLTIRSRSIGFSPKENYMRAFELEDFFASVIPFSFDEELGYIVKDIFYFGTAFFQSVLLSIPGIVMMGQLSHVIQDLKKNGLNANGYYAPNSHASMGWVYFIYNETSVGGNENEQIMRFSNVVMRLIYLEREMRLQLYLKNKIKMIDMIARALAIAKSAKLLNTDEAIDLAFKIKMGLSLNLIKGVSDEEFNAVFYKVQVAHVIYDLLNSGVRSVSDELIKAERARILNKFAEKVGLLLS